MIIKNNLFNKIDKEGANVENVKTELTKYEIEKL